MAYTMGTNQTNYLFSLAKNLAKLIQIFCMFYAFFSLLYWLLYASDVKGIENYFWIFKPAWDFVRMFYTYKPNINNELIDFTGVISAICLIILSNSFKSVFEFVNGVEQKYKIDSVKRAEKQSKIAAKNTSAAKIAPKDLIGFIFILEIQITTLSNFIQEEKITPEEVENLKERFYKALLDNLNQNQITQKGQYKKKLFLIYKDINYIDNFIFYTRETLNSLSREFSKPTIRIDFLVGLTRLKTTDNINEEINILDTIICLGIKNEFICTSTFKTNYDERTKKQYKPVTKGVYNLSKNLNITNNQEIYSLRENS